MKYLRHVSRQCNTNTGKLQCRCTYTVANYNSLVQTIAYCLLVYRHDHSLSNNYL